MRTFIFSDPTGTKEEIVKALDTDKAWTELQNRVGDITGWILNGNQG
jgi:hypothetical protein